MWHLKGNRFLAMDIKTTGDDVDADDIISMSFVPSNFSFKPKEGKLPLSLLIQPEGYTKESYKGMRLGMRLDDFLKQSSPYAIAFDNVLSYLDSLAIGSDKYGNNSKFVLIGHGLDKKIPFIRQFFQGFFDDYFHRDVRDVKTIAVYYNDVYGYREEIVPFCKITPTYLANLMKIDRVSQAGGLHRTALILQEYEYLVRHCKLL